ncbi:MAG: GH3 auxin-responsive promoter family protein [Pirellulaceae bacterium]|nr:GH3 auxin-responsive promoter family protein [Pirellulaceae bacterium]
MFHRYAYLWYRGLRVKRLLHGARHATSVQRRVLRQKLLRNGASEFARHHGLNPQTTVEAFRRQMPITTYADYHPYIERVKEGDTSAMFGPRTKVLMFALTSGTTSESKYIPVTDEFLKEYRRGWNLWGVQTFRQHLDLVRKHVVQLTSDWQQFNTSAGIPCGNISGLAVATAPRISDPMFLLPRSLIKVTNSFAKQYTALRLAVASPTVGMIITANPSTLVEFARLADQQRELIIRDIHDGTLAVKDEIPPGIRDVVLSDCRRANPTRARMLDQMVNRKGSLLPRDFWPDMSVLAVWTGGSVGAYLPRLKEYYGEVTFRDHGLSASEGRMTIPLDAGTSDGMLDFAHSYFEFVPEGELESDSPTILESHELEVGQNYYILLTTSSGFYRYNIHDVVRCTGYRGTAPLLKFLNKGSCFSSITGEKLSEFQVVTAVQSAFQRIGVPLDTFTVAPTFADPPGYVLLLESGSWEGKQAALAREVDRELSQMNCEYANRLQSKRLESLSIVGVAPGTWRAFRDLRIQRLGGSLEQYKHPCLVNDLQFVTKLRQLQPTAAALRAG